jgi:hypothetical protein
VSSQSERLPADQAARSPLLPVPNSSYRGILRQPRVSPSVPANQVTLAEAASILGCSISTVRRLVVTARARHGSPEQDDVLMRANVEGLATEVYSWRLHLDDPDPYWLTGQRAADTLGLSRARLSQLAADNRIPFVRHQDGTRMYRRRQLELIASSGSLGRRVSATATNRAHGSTSLERGDG